jgi:hypothetical protein
MTPITIPIKKVVLVFQILILVMIVASCRKKEPILKVWISGGDWLNGNVKEVFIGDDKYFDKDFFDKKGDLMYTSSRSLNIWEDKDGKHSEIDSQKVIYSSLYDISGNKIAMTASYRGDNIHKSKWEFDKSGRAVNFIPDITDTPYLCTSHCKYDAKGDMIEYKEHFCSHREPELYKYKYNNEHQMVESSLSDDSYLLAKTNYQYLEFDSHKNWTKCISRRQSFPPLLKSYRTDTITRKITYY